MFFAVLAAYYLSKLTVHNLVEGIATRIDVSVRDGYIDEQDSARRLIVKDLKSSPVR
jgi:hypothetical protein